MLVAAVGASLVGAFWGSRPVMLASAGFISFIGSVRARRGSSRPEVWVSARVAAFVAFGLAVYELLRRSGG